MKKKKTNLRKRLINCRDMQKNISSLGEQKNQLLGEKNSANEKYQKLLHEHHHLKKQLEKSKIDINKKFDKKNEFNRKVDELNQETANLLEEIDEWQT